MDSKSRSQLFNPHNEEAASGFPIEPAHLSETSKDPPGRVVSHSGPLAPGMRWTSSGRGNDDASTVSTKSGLSTLSGLVASRRLSTVEYRDKLASSRVDATNQSSFSQSFGDPTRKQDRRRQSPMLSGSQISGRISMKEADAVSFLIKKLNFFSYLILRLL